MNKLKRSGPSIEPCGTPAITSFKLLNLLFKLFIFNVKLNAFFKKPYTFTSAEGHDL